MSGRLPSIYADPALYDLVHAEGTDDEVWLLTHLAERHGCGIKTALEPGGIFVLGLDLSVYGQDEPDEEVWECRQGGRRARHIVMSIPAEPGTRRERIINFVTTPKGKKEAVLESAYDLRSYSAAEIAELIEQSPLRVEAVYGCDGKASTLGGPERALWLVLKTA